MSPEIRVLASSQEVFELAAEEFVRQTNDAVSKRGRFTVALSGGSTPKALYQLLVERYAAKLPWAQIFFFWGDERHVPPDQLEDGVDQDRLAARPVAEQIGVGRGLRVEQLTKHQHVSPPASDGGRLVPGSCRCGYAAIRALTRQAGQRRDTPGFTQVVAPEMGIAYGWPAYNHIFAQFREMRRLTPVVFECRANDRQLKWPGVKAADAPASGRERRLPCNRREILQNLDP